MKMLHRRPSVRRGLCASLFGKSSFFVTADTQLRRVLRLLPNTRWHCNSERHVLIQGAAGVGKRTLALHCWRIMQSPARLLVTEKCHFIRSVAQLRQCLQDARGGDLLLDSIDRLSRHLYDLLLALITRSRAVRVIATTEKS